MKHTWNKFKNKVSEMTDKEKREFLKELHNQLMYAYTKRFETDNTMKCRNLRKKIAYVKTMLNMKGYHYNPR